MSTFLCVWPNRSGPNFCVHPRIIRERHSFYHASFYFIMSFISILIELLGKWLCTSIPMAFESLFVWLCNNKSLKTYICCFLYLPLWFMFLFWLKYRTSEFYCFLWHMTKSCVSQLGESKIKKICIEFCPIIYLFI